MVEEIQQGCFLTSQSFYFDLLKMAVITVFCHESPTLTPNPRQDRCGLCCLVAFFFLFWHFSFFLNPLQQTFEVNRSVTQTLRSAEQILQDVVKVLLEPLMLAQSEEEFRATVCEVSGRRSALVKGKSSHCLAHNMFYYCVID